MRLRVVEYTHSAPIRSQRAQEGRFMLPTNGCGLVCPKAGIQGGEHRVFFLRQGTLAYECEQANGLLTVYTRYTHGGSKVAPPHFRRPRGIPSCSYSSLRPCFRPWDGAVEKGLVIGIEGCSHRSRESLCRLPSLRKRCDTLDEIEFCLVCQTGIMRNDGVCTGIGGVQFCKQLFGAGSEN